ncbi:uncharacterized protein LOC116999023 isoform X1 [Catharus ustulatus]|uniref:uncharacterized protein LOC116999023 isoform X1 n=1 Tax=Catharus ustulatus TaxID=91951 RepID=UPI00140BEE32|nr:uncharacterized protein LOC116999023 isoform X1 [Catharus ustulatus]
MDTCKRWRLQRLVLQAARGHCARRWSSSGKSCSSWRMPLRVHRKRPGALRPHWGARQRWRWAELQRGVELQLLGAEPSPDWLRGDHQGALKGPLERPGQSQAELSAMLASGVEPEVLVSIKALCKAREEELQRPRPLRETQEEAQDWLEQAQAALGRHSPGAVLWALEALANHSTRALLASPAPSPQAPPTLRSHIQGCWGAVGGIWAQLPPLLSHLAQLKQRLQELQPHLEGKGSTCEATRLTLTRAGLEGFWGSLSQELQRQNCPKSPKSTPKSHSETAPELLEFDPKSDPKLSKLDSKSAPKSQEFDPKLAPKILELTPKVPKSPELAPKSDPKFDPKLAPKLPEFTPKLAPKIPKSDPKIPKLSEFAPKFDPKLSKFDPILAPKAPRSQEFAPKSRDFAPISALGRLQRRLQRGRGRVLRLQQHLRFLSAATRGRRAALRPLQEQVVGVARAGLGSAPPQLEGEGRHRRGLVLGALGEPLPNPGALPPLWETGRGLGGPQGALLSRAAILKQQLRQGALSVHRRRGLRGLGVGPGPEVPPLTPPPELTTQLRLVSTSCQERIRAWPRLLDLLDQWWTLPAQWTLATPRGHAPFSHWLQRWQSAALTLQATPTLEEGEGQGKKAPPPEGL